MHARQKQFALRADYHFAHSIAVPVLAYAAVEQGDRELAHQHLARLPTRSGRKPWVFTALVDAAAGRIEPVVERCHDRLNVLSRPPTLNTLPFVALGAVVGRQSADSAVRDAVGPGLQAVLSAGVKFCPMWPVDLTLGTGIGGPKIEHQARPVR